MRIKTLCVTALVQVDRLEELASEAVGTVYQNEFPLTLRNVKAFCPTGKDASEVRREIVLTAEVDASEEDAMQCAESIANTIDGIHGLQDVQWAVAST